MNVNLLETLLQLFAILAKEDGITEKDNQVVRSFLVQQFNEAIANEYIEVFKEFAQREENLDIRELCSSVNNELTYEQKLFILIRLIELAYTDEAISLHEVKNIILTAKFLNIDYKEYQNIFNFITSSRPSSLNIKNLLIIGYENIIPCDNFIQVDNLSGYLAVLLVPTANLYITRYIGSSNIYLNGQNMQPGVVYFINPGGVIRASRVEPIYYSDIVDSYLHSTRKQKIAFEVRNLSYVFANGKVGFRNIHLYEESGRLVAFMGASGAGKSTLLNVLNGVNKPATGYVRINNIDIHQKPKSIEGLIGYVAQDDLLIEELTVYENLFFNAQLCFGNLNNEQIDELVRETLNELGLLEIKELKVGSPLNVKISGGQRKRLNIALELIREPQILFVDEPTSGLSSQDSENVMDLLKVLANKGKLVFVVIHQPSSEIFKLFDKVFIMDTGGYPVYYGNPLEAIRYFRRNQNYVNSEYVECQECGNVNPEQIFTIIEAKLIDEQGKFTNTRKISPVQWFELHNKNFVFPTNLPKYPKPDSNIQRPSRLKQFFVFAYRDILTKVSNTTYFIVSLVVAPLLAYLLSFLLKATDSKATRYSLYENDNLPAYIFVSILVALFVGLTMSAEEILRDRKIRKREAFLHLSKSSYLMSKIMVLFALSALQMAAYVIIGHSVMEIVELKLDYWLLLFSVACFANLMGLNISATFNSAVTIYIIIPLVLIPQIILSGALVKFDSLHPSIANNQEVPLVGDLMVSRWGYEALIVRQFTQNGYEKNFFRHDFIINDAKYRLNHWLAALETWASFCSNHYEIKEDKRLVEDKLALLRLELKKELFRLKWKKYETLLKQLNTNKYSRETDADLQRLFNQLRLYYLAIIDKATNKRKQVAAALERKQINLSILQEEFANRRLTELLENRNSIDKYFETSKGIIRTSDPIYYVNPPPTLLSYRTHLFSPQKFWLGYVFDTYWFNILFIWFFSIALYVTLYLELFRLIFQKINYGYSKIQNIFDEFKN
jgi:ABC-type multidrug transport system ATPase subunit/uncharacterized tellurite resistance protein B-like protein